MDGSPLRFKLHAVVNQLGQLVVFEITTGKIADNNPELLKNLLARLTCFLYGDRGYITSLKEEFAQKDLHLSTKLRTNMKKSQVLTEAQQHYRYGEPFKPSWFNRKCV